MDDSLPLPLEQLVQPLRKRFRYHFMGERRTNCKEKVGKEGEGYEEREEEQGGEGGGRWEGGLGERGEGEGGRWEGDLGERGRSEGTL